MPLVGYDAGIVVSGVYNASQPSLSLGKAMSIPTVVYALITVGFRVSECAGRGLDFRLPPFLRTALCDTSIVMLVCFDVESVSLSA